MQNGATKRIFDVAAALLASLILLPFGIIIALIILADGGQPVLFTQDRMGLKKTTFRVMKFRTMAKDSTGPGKPAITASGDKRITRFGRWLRRTKMDELPQFWNVLKGEMSLVGPRPELPIYLDSYPPELRAVLDLKPGITDPAALYFRNEEALLAGAADIDAYYRHVCLPAKLAMSLAYGQSRSFMDDIRIILRTIVPGLHLVTRAEAENPSIFSQVTGIRQVANTSPSKNS